MSQELIKKLKETTLEDLPNITDAMFEGDPNGTNADKSYFVGNVHNFMKNIAGTILLENTKFVDFAFSDEHTALLDPFYKLLTVAYSQVKSEGSSDTNKYMIQVYHSKDSYIGPFVFDSNGYIIIQGMNANGTILSGEMDISTGYHVLKNLKINGDIVISGGSVLFENCSQVTGTTQITGGSSVQITRANHWGPLIISDNPPISNVNLWCEDILNMRKVSLTNNSIVVPANLLTSKIVLRRIAAQGDYSDAGKLLSEVSGFESNILAKPII